MPGTQVRRSCARRVFSGRVNLKIDWNNRENKNHRIFICKVVIKLTIESRDVLEFFILRPIVRLFHIGRRG